MNKAIFFSILSGIVSAALGMGGGVVLLSVMLSFKTNPKIMSATSTFRSNCMTFASGLE